MFMQHCNEWGYMAIGLTTAVPCILLPAILEPRNERRKPLSQRYWVKANLWIAIFSFVGNYLWTHYFYRLLGAQYTFPSWRLNDVRCSPTCLITLYKEENGYGHGLDAIWSESPLVGAVV